MMSDRKEVVLLTGASGFIGHNIAPILRERFQLLTPTRKELNLLDAQAVEEYIKQNKVEYIVHTANPNGQKNEEDAKASMLDASLRCFMNLVRMQDWGEKLLYIGSGAEFDKRLDMMQVMEADFGRSIPDTEYGFAKYVMNAFAHDSQKIFNLRIFGCYGPGDYYTKFITHCINSIKANQDITIRQDCYFDYIQVQDLARVIEYALTHELKYHDYNVCSGQPILLSEIAEKVINVYKANVDSGIHTQIEILQDGMNKAYTGNNFRLMNELSKHIPDFKWISYEEGIRMQIQAMENEPVIP